MLKTLSPPDLPLDVLERFALAAYGLEGRWTRLDGERDQNFRVETAKGARFVFKVCHPAEGLDVLTAQAEALEHIAATDPSLPVPRLLRSKRGDLLPQLEHDRSDYPVMLLSWLEGGIVGDADLSRLAYRELGKLLARLGHAMRGFVHAAPAGRDLVWDTRQVLRLEPQVNELAEQDRDLASDILARHRDVTIPAMRRMRSQIIHGDVHPYNALLGPDGLVSGIIDFGDMVHGALILDLANAVGDFLKPGIDVEAMIFEMVRGYASVTPLEEGEADALLDLIEVRLLMTPLIDALKARNGIASQGYFAEFNSRSMPMIRVLREMGEARLRGLIRRAAAYPALPPEHAANAGEAIARRKQVMGEKLYVFYDPPLHMVKGEGVWLTASDGRRYLDCYNNVPHVGHCHPYVTEAIARQARAPSTPTPATSPTSRWNMRKGWQRLRARG